MTIPGIRISPAAIANAVASNSLSEAEAKLRDAEEVMRKASAQWETFGSGPVVKAVNSRRPLSQREMTDLIIGIYQLVRGTASVLAAQRTALAATVQAIKAVNGKS